MTVANLLMPVAGLIKARYRGAKADIDSPFFKLHYRTTATLFFICCLLVTANDLIGSTISCFGPEGVPGGLLNTYCWIMSTFSVPGSGGAHPGLGPETGEETVHAYYQWVPFVLFLQGVMFYIPHYLWKTFEHKKIDKITSGVRGKTLPINTDKRRDSLEDPRPRLISAVKNKIAFIKVDQISLKKLSIMVRKKLKHKRTKKW